MWERKPRPKRSRVYRRLDGTAVHVGDDPKFEFLKLGVDDLFVYLARMPRRGSSGRDLVVLGMLRNAERVLKESEFRFTPKWWRGMPMERRWIARALPRLAEAGFLEYETTPGRYPIVRMKKVDPYNLPEEQTDVDS